MMMRVIETIRSGTISSSGEVVVSLIGLMLQLLMDRMNGIIAPQEIMRRVTTQGNASGIRLSEVRSNYYLSHSSTSSSSINCVVYSLRISS